jgi:putative DNA primase/helicase
VNSRRSARRRIAPRRSGTPVVDAVNVTSMCHGVLSTSHRRELELSSAIDPAVIAERGYRTLTSGPERDELAALGVGMGAKVALPGLLLPMFRATGELISVQFKPAKPVLVKGKAVKYFSPRGQTNQLDVHPRNHHRIKDVHDPLWIIEGIKKSDSLTSRGCCVVALTGVFAWRSKLGTLGDWEDIPIKGREIILCFDADATKNMNVARAMVRLGRWCKSKGAKAVRYLIVPYEVNNTTVKGADDYFAAGGTIEALIATATTTEPNTEDADDTFSDSRLAETVADEVLTDRFAWCKALGWLGWSGQRWAPVTDESVGEAVRRFVIKHFTEAATAGKTAAMKGWQSMLSAGRQRAVLSLTKGIVERDAADFDADPDVLNTPGGIVDLRTGHRSPHDPEALMTKITRGNYRTGYTHPDWTQALTALPEDVQPWLQTRVGQAITGHPTPDGVIPILQGSGENGKSAITTDGIVPAFGDYAAPASPKLIAGSKVDHSTERADLRGQRFLIAEELTEDRSLNVTAIKQITDVSVIKARYVFKDNFSFPASHSLFATTNSIPAVEETDHGTWRRLLLVTFPCTFRKAGEALTAATDRRGDSGLKARIRGGADGQHDAIVTWAVEGSRQWYQTGFPPLPTTVDHDTRAWRRQADRILGFWDECLIADAVACVLTTELLATFNNWLRDNGHQTWPQERLHPRFKGHAETIRHHVVHRRTTHFAGLCRTPGTVRVETPRQAWVYAGVRFRAKGEVDQNIEEYGALAVLADLGGTLSQGSSLAKVPDGSATSASSCCEGGPLQPRCKLCSRSSSYWQLNDQVLR